MTVVGDWLLGGGRTAPGKARRAIETWARTRALDEAVVSSLLLVANEMVTHAVEHSDGRVALSADVGRVGITVRVSVACRDVAHAPWPIQDGVRQRGQMFVTAICLDWGFSQRPGRRTIWARVPRW